MKKKIFNIATTLAVSGRRAASQRPRTGSSKFRIPTLSGKCIGGSLLALLMLAAISTAYAKSAPFQVLHAFNGVPEGSYSFTPLIVDTAGNFYGTASQGGNTGCNGFGCGTVFKLAPDGNETVLHTFANFSDGAVPYSNLLINKAGNLYGTTYDGGNYNAGTVFKVAPDGTETVLYTFTSGSDGSNPDWGVIMDKAGNLYGTTPFGGASAGVVFKLAPDGTETVLYTFQGGSDGNEPSSGLIKDKQGNFYGTTYFGGTLSCSLGGPAGCGTVFKLAPDGTETVLYAFHGGNDGGGPSGGLIRDKAGNFYGTTAAGGPSNSGTVFKLTPTGTETVLYAFSGGNDGSTPSSSLIMDKAGNLYGTSYYGGTTGNGTVFKVAPDGTETVLYSFTGGTDGANPSAPLLLHKGRFYSTTSYAGA